MKITHVAEIVKLSHVAEIVKLTHVARILEAGSMYDPKYMPKTIKFAPKQSHHTLYEF